MSLSGLEGRSLPSVFSDIPSRNEVQQARQRIGQLGIWIILLVGALIVAGLAIAYFVNEWQQAKTDAFENEQDRAALELRLGDYGTLDGRRNEIADDRENLHTKIFGNADNRRPPDSVRRRAEEAYANVYRLAGQSGSLEFSGQPPAQWSARSWGEASRTADTTLTLERSAIQAAEAAADAELRRLRSGGQQPTGCTNPNPALCPATP